MFNGYSALTFAAVFLFWVLAVYVGTRGPRSLVSSTVVATQIVAAAYLFGQGMLANALTLSDWAAWARGLQWGVAFGPALWYGLTTLLLRDEPEARSYVRFFAYPLAILVGAFALVICSLTYGGNLLYRWSTPIALFDGPAQYFTFRAPAGPLYGLLVLYMVVVGLGALTNAAIGARLATDDVTRRHFRWLLASALLIALGTVPTALANWQDLGWWPVWLGHLCLATGQIVMVVDVATYSFFLHDRVIQTDLLGFLLSMVALGALYLAVGLLVLGYNFQVLPLLALLPLLAVLTHASAGFARRIVDRLVFSGDVRQVRGQLTAVVQEAGTTSDLGALLTQAQTDLQTARSEHDVQVVEQALRKLNNPAALSRCGLASRIPRVLQAESAAVGEMTPLERARILREVLARAIVRLRPAENGASAGPSRAASDLLYNILNDEYLNGVPNKQIMRRYAIGEGTFHRHRREAIRVLAHELLAREDRLASATSANESANLAVFGGFHAGSGATGPLD